MYLNIRVEYLNGMNVSEWMNDFFLAVSDATRMLFNKFCYFRKNLVIILLDGLDGPVCSKIGLFKKIQLF